MSVGTFLAKGESPPQNRERRHDMHILWSLIVGLIVGAVAKLIMPGKDPGGILITMLIGVAGSVIAGFLGRTLGVYHAGDAGPGLIASIIGAVLLLAGYRMLVRRRAL
jgi:uncharacterized membrane protein YeaQ/YmgE (transglycosylase-associated protein family)